MQLFFNSIYQYLNRIYGKKMVLLVPKKEETLIWVLFSFKFLFMQKIVTDMLQRYRKTISESQMEKIMRKESSCNPLWLTIVCEELQSVENVEDIDQKIECLPEGLLK